MKDESNILQNSSVTTKSDLGDKGESVIDYATILRNILFRTLTFVMSIELTGQWYYNFMQKQQWAYTGFAYTLPFICVVVLLSDLLIDDEETD
jgi:hypothetical protein